MIAALLITFVVLFLIGTPIFLCLGGAALIPNIVNSSFIGTCSYITRMMVGGIDNTTLIALPLFVLAGVLMGVGGISEKIFNVFALITGRTKSGIPIAVILTSMVYGAICGAGAPAAAAVGAMAIPIMTRLGYDKRFAAGLVAAGGGIGLIIPPSLGYVVYGSMTGTSVGALFSAGFLPGIVIGLCLIIYAIIFCHIKGVDMVKIEANYNALRSKGVWHVIKDSFWALLSPVIILGCIYGGVTTPTEAACLSVWYSLIICVFVYKTIKPKEIFSLLKEAVSQYAGITVIMAFGMALTRVFELLNMPSIIANFLTSTFSSSGALLFAIIIVLLIIGMFMDVMPTIVIFAPILYPVVVQQFGVSDVHFGIIMVSTVALGLITPPYGLNIFVTCNMIGEDAGRLFKQCILVSLCYFIAMMFITYIPDISLLLPRLFGNL